MQRIKVLHIIKSLGRGGAEVLLPETLKLHDKTKFEFHYIYFLPWKDQMVKTIKDAEGTVVCFEAANNLKLLGQASKVRKYCELNNIQLIHCHLPWSGFLGRIVHYQTGIPLIYSEHNIQERYHPATRLLNKISFNYQSIALGVSQDVTRSIKEHIHPKIPVRTLLNGVNTTQFKRNSSLGFEIRKQYKIPEGAIVIGNIAVFREQKCIPLWLKAFQQILIKHPGVYGLLVGAGPEEEKIKEMVQDLNLTENIILPGLQTDTVAYFSAMDIFMMSSSFEGLPIALLEAMSMECATVATKAGGVVEVITDNVDGKLCEVGDFTCLANSSNFLIENSVKMEILQERGRKRIMDSFSLSVMVMNLENVYLSLTSQN